MLYKRGLSVYATFAVAARFGQIEPRLDGTPWCVTTSVVHDISHRRRARQAASVAAVMALVFTRAGSHTKASYVSTTPPARPQALSVRGCESLTESAAQAGVRCASILHHK